MMRHRQSSEQALGSDSYIFSNQENMQVMIDRLKADIERYRTKTALLACHGGTPQEARRHL